MTYEEMKHRLNEYRQSLVEEEKKCSTIKKYVCDIWRFLNFMEHYLNSDGSGTSGKGEEIDKSCIIRYKENLNRIYKPASVNSYLIGLNRYLRWLGEDGMVVKLERIQKKCSLANVMTKSEYEKLLDYAVSHGKKKYYCIMKTLASTGIRVGELQFITCEALEEQVAVISNKGKIREICIPDSLCNLLEDYCTERQIHAGIIFSGWSGDRALDVSGIWKTLKRMAAEAGVDPDKVYPHSFRHLFARMYMKKVGNLMILSDILGHTNIETTRIYTMGTMEEKRESMSLVGL